MRHRLQRSIASHLKRLRLIQKCIDDSRRLSPHTAFQVNSYTTSYITEFDDVDLAFFRKIQLTIKVLTGQAVGSSQEIHGMSISSPRICSSFDFVVGIV